MPKSKYNEYVLRAIRSLPISLYREKEDKQFTKKYIELMKQIRNGKFGTNVLIQIEKDLDSVFNNVRHRVADSDQKQHLYKVGTLVIEKYIKLGETKV